MTGIPDRIVLGRHRELEGRSFNRPVRYLLLTLIAAVPVLGLANLFGQHPETLTANRTEAELELLAPAHVRGGILYEARFTVFAHEKLTHAVLMLSPGWAESTTINTIEPSPIAETSRDGNLLFTLGTVPKGQRYTFYLEFQVNPTNVGRRHADVVLYDGNERLLSIDRVVTVFP